MYTSHAVWGQHMIEQCLVLSCAVPRQHMIELDTVLKNQPRRVYNYFKKYNEELQEHLIVNLTRNLSEINLKGIFLVLAHGNVAHLKRRNNVRLLRQFAVKGIETLKDERKTINEESAFDMVCTKYYEYSYRFCLNA